MILFAFNKIYLALCPNGQLRLAGGTTLNEGRVEICFNETWGTICDDAWDGLDASVACSSLHYSRYSMLVYKTMMKAIAGLEEVYVYMIVWYVTNNYELAISVSPE